MILTPRAKQVVSEAMRALPSGSVGRDRWYGWAEHQKAYELPDHLVSIVQEALGCIGHVYEERLKSGSLTEDEEADLLNDLGYIRAIENELRREVARGLISA